MTKQEISELVAYVREVQDQCADQIASEKAALNYAGRLAYEERDKVRAELAEVKSKLTGTEKALDEFRKYASRNQEADAATQQGEWAKSNAATQSKLDDKTDRQAHEFCGAQPEQKPLRLLVEVIQKKDEKHGSRVFGVPGLVLEAPIWQSHGFSVQEFPEMPSENYLADTFYRAASVYCPDVRKGIRAVLKACGLEVV